MFNLRAGRWRRGRIPSSRYNRKLKHERSQSSNNPLRRLPVIPRARAGGAGGGGEGEARSTSPPPPPPWVLPSPPPATFLMQTRFPTFLDGHTHTHTFPPSSPPRHPRGGRRCRAWGQQARRGRHRCHLPLPGEPCPCPLHRLSPSSLEAAARPLGAAPARHSSLPKSPPPVNAGSPLPPLLPAARGAGRRPEPYLGCRCRLSPRRAAHPSCAPPAAGSDASPGRLWAWRGQGARPGTERSRRFSPAARLAARCPTGREGCAAVRGSGTAHTGHSRRAAGRGRGGEERRGERGGGGKFHKVE